MSTFGISDSAVTEPPQSAGFAIARVGEVDGAGPADESDPLYHLRSRAGTLVGLGSLGGDAARALLTLGRRVAKTSAEWVRAVRR